MFDIDKACIFFASFMIVPHSKIANYNSIFLSNKTLINNIWNYLNKISSVPQDQNILHSIQ